MKRFWILGGILIFSFLLANVRQISSFKRIEADQQKLATTICEFVQNQAQIGATREALDQAHNLLQASPMVGGARANVLLTEGPITYGSKATDSNSGNVSRIPCAITGLGDVHMIFEFPKDLFWTRSVFQEFFVFSFIFYILLLCASKALSVLTENVTDAISSEVANALHVTESQHQKKTMLFKILAAGLSSKVKLIKPQIDELKHKVEIANQNTLADAAVKVKLQTESENAKEFIKSVRLVNHDLQSPISALKVLASTISDDDKKERIDLIVKRIENIADDLLNKEGIVTNSEALQMDLMETAVSEVLQEKRRQIRPGVEIKFRYDHKGLTPICVNRPHLKRLISNLIQNAAEAIKGDGLIELDVSQSGDLAKLEITDSGSGISAENLSLIFNENFTFGKERGSGLGLTHAKACIERWNGTIAIDSKLGVATKLSITLPLAETQGRFVGPKAIAQNKIIVGLDDQPGFIQGEFEKIHPLKAQVLKPKEFLDWFALDACPAKHSLSIDLHLGEKFSGLDVMRQIPDSFDRVLTTDDHFNEKAMELSHQLNFAILPKSLLRSFKQPESFQDLS